MESVIMSSFFKLDSLTREQRQLRQNIRNAYCASTIPELLHSQRMRAMAKRNGFELTCFDELIAESNCGGDNCCGCLVCVPRV